MFQRIKAQFDSILFFSLLFAILGALVPDLYYKHLDTRNYVRIDSAVVYGGNLKPCGNVDILMKRTADFTVQGNAIIEMVLVREDAPEKEAQRISRVVSIEKGYKEVVQTYPLDCSLNPGNYLARASIRYDVRGGEHITEWQSDTFVIK